MKEHYLLFVIGPTNAGKGEFLNAFAGLGDVHVHLVEVGKLMRAKYLDPASPHYDPDHFKGEAAPTHTAKEAWQMMEDGIAAGVKAGAEFILVDGQPRDIEQCNMIIDQYENGEDFTVEYVHIYASEAIRRERAMKRDAGDEAKLKLSLSRLSGDMPKLYEVLTRLINNGSRVHTINNDYQYPILELARMVLEACEPVRAERIK